MQLLGFVIMPDNLILDCSLVVFLKTSKPVLKLILPDWKKDVEIDWEYFCKLIKLVVYS